MANAIYPIYKQKIMSETANRTIAAGTISVAICNSSYTYSDTHEYRSSITGGLVANNNLTTPTVYANATFEDTGSATITFTAVPAGTPIESLVIYKFNTNDADSPLVAYLDAGITNLPVTPNGGDITITWDLDGIFTL
jgi:hypothetical protein